MSLSVKFNVVYVDTEIGMNSVISIICWVLVLTIAIGVADGYIIKKLIEFVPPPGE